MACIPYPKTDTLFLLVERNHLVASKPAAAVAVLCVVLDQAQTKHWVAAPVVCHMQLLCGSVK